MIIKSCPCCALNIEISDCNESGFFGHLLDSYRNVFLTPLITSQNKAIRFCFISYPAATMRPKVRTQHAIKHFPSFQTFFVILSFWTVVGSAKWFCGNFPENRRVISLLLSRRHAFKSLIL